MDNSKLEAGQRELTAVVVMPSFVPHVKFESTGNWFLLHDPEQLIVPTDRMLKQSQKVAVLKQELRVTEDCGHFRDGDLERLQTRIDQVEEILPMQTHTVKVPFSDVSGFELFTPDHRLTGPGAADLRLRRCRLHRPDEGDRPGPLRQAI